jgi:hypothetical protein
LDTYRLFPGCSIAAGFSQNDVSYCGCKSITQCLCFEEEGYSCKGVSKDIVCCICWQQTIEIVSCQQSVCKCYRQIYCIECFCGYPFENAFINTDMIFTNKINKDGRVHDDEVTPCM